MGGGLLVSLHTIDECPTHMLTHLTRYYRMRSTRHRYNTRSIYARDAYPLAPYHHFRSPPPNEGWCVPRPTAHGKKTQTTVCSQQPAPAVRASPVPTCRKRLPCQHRLRQLARSSDLDGANRTCAESTAHLNRCMFIRMFIRMFICQWQAGLE
jgi:hypothetical protein